MPHSTSPSPFENKVVSSIAHLPGALPSIALPKDLNKSQIATAASTITASLTSPTLSPDLFTQDAFWRDQFSLTHNLRTFYSPDRILSAWADTAPVAKVRNVNFEEKAITLQPTWAIVPFTFDADLSDTEAECQGLLYLVPSDSGGVDDLKIWMLLTWCESPRLRPGQDLRLNPQHHERPDPTSISDLDVLIIGGGQAGLATASWCKSYGLKYIVLEKNARVGDNWTKRYESAKLHTTQRFNDLPFGPTFTAEDPEYLSTQALATGYQRFVKQFGIDIWTSCRLVEPAKYDSLKKKWAAKIVHNDAESHDISASHIVLCTGAGGTVPLLPKIPGRETFKGTALHSAEYQNSNAFGGKRGVVVGSANTGHDVARDMLEAGLSSVTMVQRGATYVVGRVHFKELFAMIWNDNMSQEFSDRIFWSTPTGVSRLMTNAFLHSKADGDIEMWRALDRAGFNVDSKADFIDHLLVRFGGHYMDCGVSQKIADGEVKIKGDALITRYTPDGLAFSDGSEVKADLIVWATGFEKEIRPTVAPVIGDKLTTQLRDFWGVNEEGEVKGAFVHSGVENCWMTGGGCAHARYFTRFVALQILFDRLGHPLQPYEKGT